MNSLNYLAIAASTVAAFVFASAWYIAWSEARERLSSAASAQHRPPSWQMPVEIVRTLLVALIVAGLVSRLGATTVSSALLLALALWIAFPVILLSGSVLYENVPARLAAIHAGDWLGKLFIITIVVGVWR